MEQTYITFDQPTPEPTPAPTNTLGFALDIAFVALLALSIYLITKKLIKNI